MNSGKQRILVVGQTPPPFGGQAVMIDNILKGNYQNIQLFHVRMAFSKEMNEVGKLKFFKIYHLFDIVIKIVYVRFRHKIRILYFPPTGPNKIPFYRDAFILILVRPFFNKTCFHFHASGIAELYSSLNFFSKFLFRKAYYNADVGIKLSASSPDDYVALRTKSNYIVPYGIDDFYTGTYRKKENVIPAILFVGLLTESKGPLLLVEACNLLKRNGLNFNANIIGKFESADFENRVRTKVAEYGLNDRIRFLGVVTGAEKFEFYERSDIFCFPTFFEAESFPVVLLEASSFALPIVSTQWRGVPSLVENEETGFLCPVKDFRCVAEKLQLLIEQPELRKKMGDEARKVFLEKFTLAKFYENIEQALSTL